VKSKWNDAVRVKCVRLAVSEVKVTIAYRVYNYVSCSLTARVGPRAVIE